MDQIAFYEQQAREKNKLISSAICKRDQFIIDYITRKLDVSKFSLNIAELSIGDGSLTRALIASLDKIQLTCVDISPSRIEAVKKMIEQVFPMPIEKIYFLKCNLDTQFSLLPSSNFDAVLAIDVMEHVFDVFSFVKNCHRILKGDGILLLRVPNIAYIKRRIGLLFGKLPITASWFGSKEGDLEAWQNQWGWDGGHLHFFTIAILYRLLKDYGFKIEECQDPGSRFSAIRNLWPSLLYGNQLVVARKI